VQVQAQAQAQALARESELDIKADHSVPEHSSVRPEGLVFGPERSSDSGSAATAAGRAPSRRNRGFYCEGVKDF
jgi:hypothetical protein